MVLPLYSCIVWLIWNHWSRCMYIHPPWNETGTLNTRLFILVILPQLADTAAQCFHGFQCEVEHLHCMISKYSWSDLVWFKWNVNSHYVCTISYLVSILGLPAPPTKLMPSSTVFDAKGRPQLDVIRPHLIAEGRLTEEAILRIISETSAILRSEKTMLDLEAPITGEYSSFRSLPLFF